MTDQPIYLTMADVLNLHARIIGRHGGLPGVRDLPALESAIAQPKMAVFGRERFATVFAKAAAYCYFIVRNHPFFDGNKRTGASASLAFLRVNGIDPVYDENEMYEVIVAVATGELGVDGLAEFLREALGD